MLICHPYILFVETAHILLGGCFLTVEFWEFFPVFWTQVFGSDFGVFRYFLPVHNLSFNSCNKIFHKAKHFNCDEVQVTIVNREGVPGKMTHFLLLILHPVISLNSLLSPESFFIVDSLEFYTEAIMLSEKRLFYFFVTNLCAFYMFFLPHRLARLLVQCWIEAVKGDFLLVPGFRDKHSVFHHWVSCNL